MSLRRRLGDWIAGRQPGLRRFDGARQSRLTYGWGTTSAAINADLRMDLESLRARSRDLAANNDYARKFLRMVSDNIVGANGFTFNSLCAKPDGTPDPGDRAAVESALWAWSQAGECEVTGRLSFADCCRIIAQGVARDGEMLIRRVRNRKARFGYRLQLLDIDRLDVKYNDTLPSGNRVVMSVELDSYGAPVAYWLLTQHPGDTLPGSSVQVAQRERVPVADIFHLFVPERPEQVRGLPWMHTAMQRLQMLAGYEEAAIVAARTGAAKMGFFISPDGTAKGLEDEQDAEGNFITDAEAGAFQTLPQGYDFKPWSPEYPTQNYDAFVKACLRGLSSGLGVAYNSLANDLEGVNFSSIRSGALEERNSWMVLQDWMIGALLRPLFADWLESALLSGSIIGAGGSPLPAGKLYKFSVHAWQGRRWDWVDPEKDINAKLLAMRAGLIDPYTIAAQSGVDLEDVVARLQSANDLAVKAGLPPYFAPAPAVEAPQVVAAKTKARAIERAAELQRDAAAAAKPMHVTIQAPAPQPAPNVRVENIVQPAPSPEIHVAPADVRVENIVQPAAIEVAAPAVEVRVEAVMPEQPAPVVDVNVEMPEQLRMEITAMPTRETSTEIVRNGAGEISSSKQVERDA